MKLYKICHLLVLLSIVVYGGCAAQALNCSAVFVSPGHFVFPSSGGTASVGVSIGPDFGCSGFTLTATGPVQL